MNKIEGTPDLHSSKIRIESIIQNIRSARDQQLTLLLEDSSLMSFLEEHYNTVAASSVKIEFLMRDLKVLLNSSLDLVHYSSLITRMKETNTTIVQGSHPLFLLELNFIFKKNGF